jgi:FAD/FMN-containing dehydrogenase
LLAGFNSFAQSHAYCRAITQSVLAPVAVEELSPEAAALLAAGPGQPMALPAGQWSVLVIAAGNEAVVARHARQLRALAEQASATSFTVQNARQSLALLSASAEFPRSAQQAGAVVFRISALQASMPELVEQIRAAGERGQLCCAVLARPYGLVYAALLAVDASAASGETAVELLAAAAEEISRLATERGARACIEFAPLQVRRRVSVWGAERGDFELMRRVKRVFDPQNILCPGRFVGGI